MTNNERRRFVALLSGIVSLAAGCGSSSDEAPEAGTPPAPEAPAPVTAWRPVVPTLLVGSTATFDLRTTLPAETVAGGRFSVNPEGAPLPAGMQLSDVGVLSVGTASPGAVTGVIFSYELA